MLTGVKLNKAIRAAVNQRVSGSSPEGGAGTVKGFKHLKFEALFIFR